MGEATGTTARTSRFSRNEIKTRLADALIEATEGLTSKAVARSTGFHPDTIDSLRQGNIPEAWARFCEVGKAYPLFGLHALDLMGIDIDQDPQAFAKFLEAQRYIAERFK
jgi:hypothetical protein